ncbi:hypothetical protein D3C75_831820 [compost metagenome]
MAADDAHFVGDAAFLGIAQGCRHARVRHRHDDVGVDREFARQTAAHFLADVIDRTAVHHAVRAGEVDILEQAGAGGAGREGLDRGQAVLVDDDDFAVLDVADEGGADGVQGAGLGRQHPGLADLAQDQGADAQGVTGADHLVTGLGDQGVAALDAAQGVDEALDDLGLTAAGDQVKDGLGVRGGLEDGAFRDQLAVQVFEIRQVAVVGDGDAALVQIGEHRLDVAQEAAAGGGIAGVADRGAAGQAGGQLSVAEGLADEALMALGVEAVVVDAGDAAGFLAAMLQGVQAQRHDRRGLVLGRAPDSADAAL